MANQTGGADLDSMEGLTRSVSDINISQDYGITSGCSVEDLMSEDIADVSRSLDFELSEPKSRSKSRSRRYRKQQVSTSTSESEVRFIADVNTGKVELPECASMWCRRPNATFGTIPPWEVFGIRQEKLEDTLPAIKGKLVNIALSCGLPPPGKPSEDELMIDDIFLTLLSNKEITDENPSNKYKRLCVAEALLYDETSDCNRNGQVQQFVSSVIRKLRHVHYNFKKYRGQVAKTSVDDRHRKDAIEKDVADLFAFVCNFIFLNDTLGERTNECRLYPIRDTHEATTVKARSDLEVRSICQRRIGKEVQSESSVLLVGEIKKDYKLRLPKSHYTLPEHMNGCYPVVFQHFAELLVTLRSSLFAQNWGEVFKSVSENHDVKLPYPQKNSVFGFMNLGPMVYFTSLQVDLNLMNRIVRRNHSDFFMRNNPESVASSELHNHKSKLPVEKDCACSIPENTQVQGPGDTTRDSRDAKLETVDASELQDIPGYNKGTFYVSKVYELSDLAHLYDVMKILLLFRSYRYLHL